MKHLLLICLCLISLSVQAWTVGDKLDIDQIIIDTTALKERTSGLKARTENTLAKVEGISNSFRASLNIISDDLSDQVRYGVEDINQILAMNREGMDTFLGADTTPFSNSKTVFDFSPPKDRSSTECYSGTPCFQFREDLKGLLAQIKTLGDTAIGVNSNPAVSLNVNLDKYIDLVDRIPGRALYPVYVAMVSGGADFINGFPAILDQAIIDMQTVATIALSEVTGSVVSPTNATFPQLQYEAKGCQDVIDNYTPLVITKESLSYSSTVLKIMGKLLIANGKTFLTEPDVGGGFAEFADVEIELESNLQDSLGNALDGLSDTIAEKSSSFEQKIDYCASLRAQLNILNNQQKILVALNNIQTSSSGTAGSDVVADVGTSPTGGGGAISLVFLALLMLAVFYYKFASAKFNVSIKSDKQ